MRKVFTLIHFKLSSFINQKSKMNINSKQAQNLLGIFENKVKSKKQQCIFGEYIVNIKVSDFLKICKSTNDTGLASVIIFRTKYHWYSYAEIIGTFRFMKCHYQLYTFKFYILSNFIYFQILYNFKFF